LTVSTVPLPLLVERELVRAGLDELAALRLLAELLRFAPFELAARDERALPLAAAVFLVVRPTPDLLLAAARLDAEPPLLRADDPLLLAISCAFL
jgi:hypothetical protein